MLLFLLTLTDESNHSKVEKLYNDYHDDLMKYAVSKLYSTGIEDYRYVAEDAVQNAFLKLVKNIDKIEFSRGEKAVKNYVFAVLINEILGILNDNEAVLEFFDESYELSESSFVDELEIKERYDEVVDAIAKLDERYSFTLYFAFVLDKSVNEIAEIMGISPKTVYTRLVRGKEKIRNLLKGD